MSRSESSGEDRVVAETIDLAEIPVIDFSAFAQGKAEVRVKISRLIARACHEIGFFYLTGHGVDQNLVDELFNQSTAFYHLNASERQKVRATPDWYRGWIPSPPPAAQSRDTRLFEQYRLQSEWPSESRPNDPLARIFDRPNRWPDGMPAFKTACEAYLNAMHTLSIDLLSAFALGLDLPEDRFHSSFVSPPCQLSLLYYPPLPPEADTDASNTVSHTDEGPFTILAQGQVGGLEVKRRDGVWIAAPPIPGAFTINVGDMMMWWSNGVFLSNWHRVRNKSGGERFSIPFFANPYRDVVVGPLPEMIEREGVSRYESIKVSDHLARFYEKLEQRAQANV
jgi:isopenicillin N synthase-like dioxygenase